MVLGWIADILGAILDPEEHQIRRRIRREFDRSRPNGILPRQLAIETINHCNAACIMCPYPTLQRQKGTMSAEVHKLIVDKVKAWGAPLISISHAGMGEPLIDRKIHEKIAYEKSVFPDAKVSVFSNASALETKRAEELFDAKLDVYSVSLNAYSKDVYEKVMKLPFGRTWDNLHRFMEMNAARGKPVTFNVSLVPTEEHSEEEIAKFREYWTPLAHNVIVPPRIGWGKYQDQGVRKQQYPCRYLWDVLLVDWDGTVSMCCEDYETQFPLGNLTTQPPQEVWNSKMFQEQRRRQVEGDFAVPSICANCVESHEGARDYWKTGTVIPVPPCKTVSRA
jgi:radical SAM protein with 4Fe4S-binding SPASM domain